MASRRQDILDNIESELLDITELKTVIMHQPYAVDIETIELPSASVWTLSESESGETSGLVGYETWDWFIGIEVWFFADVDDTEDLLKIVVDKLYEEPQRGGCAIATQRMSVDPFEVYNDRETNVRGFALQIKVTYFNKYGDM